MRTLQRSDETPERTGESGEKDDQLYGADVTVYQSIDPSITTEFIGYDRLTAESEISVLTTEDEIVEALTDGQTGTIITKKTPFYGTMGVRRVTSVRLPLRTALCLK